MATMSEIAESYSRKFHAIVPVGNWTFIGREGNIIDLWKSPLIKNWTNTPLRTPEEVREQWGKYGRYGKTPNIGLVTGQICGGYIVIDLDNKPDQGINGYEELKEWQRRTGVELPETWTVITGGGGYHLYFHTDKALRGYSNHSAGVDLRADGNQVLLPPSTHKSGRRYEWEIAPKDMQCAEADEIVMRFIEEYRPAGAQYGSTRRGEGGGRKMALPPEIPDGERHNALISLIGTLNRLGVSDEAIIRVVRTENENKCRPPFTEAELQREIFPAIFRWEKGVKETEWKSRQEYVTDYRRERQMEARSDVMMQRAAKSER